MFTFRVKSSELKVQKGFTLIEILVAISIIAVVASIGFIAYSKAQSLGRDSRRKQDLRAIQTALELYYQQNKTYPVADNWLNSAGSSGNWLPALSTYINPTPVDPSNSTTNCNSSGSFATSGCYTYGYYSGGYGSVPTTYQSYILATKLENTNDADANGTGIKYLGTDWGTAPGIYVLTSP